MDTTQRIDNLEVSVNKLANILIKLSFEGEAVTGLDLSALRSDLQEVKNLLGG